MRTGLKIALLGAAIALCIVSTTKNYDFRTKYASEKISRFGQLPAPVIKALSLEFEGVIADFLFLKTMTVIGQKIGQDVTPSQQEWTMVHTLLDNITELDPRFWDPYLFGQMMLTWQAGMFDEANALLLKAAEHRPHDFRPLYFVGFNHFYFQKEFAQASDYLQQASVKPGAPSYLKGLAARLSLYGNRTEVGIAFLRQMLAGTHDPTLRSYLEKRLIALEGIHTLEKKVQEYKDQFGSLPQKLEDLVAKGLLERIPEDPYGGDFVLMDNGRVFTTSKLVNVKKKK